jgi:hypothetical protein
LQNIAGPFIYLNLSFTDILAIRNMISVATAAAVIINGVGAFPAIRAAVADADKTRAADIR